MVISGDPGSGKSFLAKLLCDIFNIRKYLHLSSDEKLPVELGYAVGHDWIMIDDAEERQLKGLQNYRGMFDSGAHYAVHTLYHHFSSEALPPTLVFTNCPFHIDLAKKADDPFLLLKSRGFYLTTKRPFLQKLKWKRERVASRFAGWLLAIAQKDERVIWRVLSHVGHDVDKLKDITAISRLVN